jgi:hypothetical protein
VDNTPKGAMRYDSGMPFAPDAKVGVIAAARRHPLISIALNVIIKHEGCIIDGTEAR